MIRSLVADIKEGRWTISLGRCSFLALFVLTMGMWSPLSDYEPSESQMDALIWLMAYNFGTKGVSAARDAITAWKGR